MKRLALLTAAVMMLVSLVTVRAQEGGAPALTPEEAKARITQLGDESKELRKKMMEARQQAVKDNPELAGKIKELKQQAMELRKQEEQLIAEACPELKALQDRMKEVMAETMRLRKAGKAPREKKPAGDRPKKEKPARKGKKGGAE